MEEVRICPHCQYHNQPSDLECEQCHADICMVHLTTPEKNPSISTTMIMPKLRLVSMKDGFAFELPECGCVVGREGFMADYLQDNLYISSRHAEIKYGTDGYILRDLSTNGTKINHLKIEKEKEYVLKEGDRITFANLVFQVSFT